MHHPTDRITHTTTFVTPVVEHWLEREIAQWVLWIRFNKMSSLVISITVERKRERERKSSQCSMWGVIKTVVCAILSVEW